MLSSLSVIIPVYNEEHELEPLVAELDELLPEIADDFEIVIVDDCSTDATPTVSKRLAAGRPFLRVVRHEQNLMLGRALATGYNTAKYDFVVPLSGSGHISPSVIRQLAENAGENIFVVGTWVTMYNCLKRPIRWSLHYGRIALAILLFGPHVASAPIYIFPRRQFAEYNCVSISGFLNIELLLRMQKDNFEIQVVRIPYIPRNKSKSKSVNLRTIFNTFRDIVMVRSTL